MFMRVIRFLHRIPSTNRKNSTNSCKRKPEPAISAYKEVWDTLLTRTLRFSTFTTQWLPKTEFCSRQCSTSGKKAKTLILNGSFSTSHWILLARKGTSLQCSLWPTSSSWWLTIRLSKRQDYRRLPLMARHHPTTATIRQDRKRHTTTTCTAYSSMPSITTSRAKISRSTTTWWASSTKSSALRWWTGW